ncbi:MAG: hypothetical protein H7Y38_06200 [Armatimonadetes bacterium]|nr:hypothetical protein [Armatimonadota bacterium]
MEPNTDSTNPVADTAMATGTDDEPEMTIADKHAGDTLPDPDGTLTEAEAAELLGADETNEETGEKQ